MGADISITRYPGGVTNVPDNSVFANLKVNDPSSYHAFFDDFDRYTAAQWVVGGVNPVAPALAAGDGGILSMATTGALNDSNFVSTAVPGFTLGTKRLFFRLRGQVDNATNAAMAAGFQVAVAGNNFLTPADGLFLRKPAADTNWYLVHRVGGVEILSAALGTIADATPFSVGLATDGQNVVGAVNDVVRGSITVPTFTAVALKVVAGVVSGTAAARTLLLDQLVAFKER